MNILVVIGIGAIKHSKMTSGKEDIIHYIKFMLIFNRIFRDFIALKD